MGVLSSRLCVGTELHTVGTELHAEEVLMLELAGQLSRWDSLWTATSVHL